MKKKQKIEKSDLFTKITNKNNKQMQSNTENTENIEKLTYDLNEIVIHENEELEKIEKMKKEIMQKNEKKRQEIEQKINQINIQNFATRIVEQEHTTTVTYKSFIESNAVNCLITAPTQVGKTDATKVFIETCLDYKIPVIVSCDNKTDQLDQFFQRVSNDLETENVVFVKACNTKIDKILTEAFKENKQAIIFCLDNAAQIKRVKNQIVLLTASENIKIEKIALIHDEGVYKH